MKLINLMIAMLFSLTLLTSCQEEKERSLTILFFSEIPQTHKEGLTKALSEIMGEKIRFRVEFYPSSAEKLIVQLSERGGDIYIANESYMLGLLGKNGLTNLDPIFHPNGIPKKYEKYRTVNEKTGESHLYGIPIEKNATFLASQGIRMKTRLVAIIPRFSQHQEKAIEVLKSLMRER